LVLLAKTYPLEQQIRMNNFCREKQIKFMLVETNGVFARLFNDFGPSFTVLDKSGDDPVEVMIKSISNEEKGVVKLLDGAKHPYEDGEVVIFQGVEGMEPGFNGSQHKVTVINSNSFYIGDTRAYSQYVRNGTAKNLKIPLEVKFLSL